jgi:hypothetical protein
MIFGGNCSFSRAGYSWLKGTKCNCGSNSKASQSQLQKIMCENTHDNRERSEPYKNFVFVFTHAAVTAHNSINICVFGPDPTSYSYTRFSVEVVVVVV